MIFKDLFVGTKRQGRLIFGREYAVGNQISTNLNKSAQQISSTNQLNKSQILFFPRAYSLPEIG